MQKLSIVIPAYNEAATIHLILNRILAVKFIYDVQCELIVVNDCSKDGTSEALVKYKDSHPELDMVIHNQETNQGQRFRKKNGEAPVGNDQRLTEV